MVHSHPLIIEILFGEVATIAILNSTRLEKSKFYHADRS